MPEKCPNCGLIKNASVLRCECGYDFHLKTVMFKSAKSAPEENEPPPESIGKTLLIISAVLIIFLTAVLVFKPKVKNTRRDSSPAEVKKAAGPLPPAETEATKTPPPAVSIKSVSIKSDDAVKTAPQKNPEGKVTAEDKGHGEQPAKTMDGSYGAINAYLKKLGIKPDNIRCTDVFYSENGWLVGCDFLSKTATGETLQASKWFIISGNEVVSMY